MNSLTYISRQFDVLASSRTPPNTPATEFPTPPPLQLSASLDDPATNHRAVWLTTWSLKSLVAPPPLTRRSLSSSLPRIPVLPRRLSIRSAICAKPQPTSQSILRRIFFIRLLELVWDVLCAAAASLRVDDVWHGRRFRPRGLRRRSVVVGKESSIERRQGTMATSVLQVSSEQAMSHSESVASSSALTLTPPSTTVSRFHVSHISADPLASDVASSSRSPLAYPSPQVLATLMPTPPPSRTPTPTCSPSAGLPIAPRRTPFHLPKTLVLDLDETLIHSTSRPLPAPGIRGLFGARTATSHTVEVYIGDRSTLYHVYKRPFVDFFLRKVSAWYTLVIFTASMKEYADPVIDWLDAGQGILGRRFFRESCTQLPNGSYTKNLALVEQDLARVCLVDNSPICYSVNEMNAIPIEGWTHDPSDEALLDLLPVLDSLRFISDVRRVLGIRGYS